MLCPCLEFVVGFGGGYYKTPKTYGDIEFNLFLCINETGLKDLSK